MAQRSRSNFKSTYDSVFADNTTGAIAASNDRDFKDDIADSFVNITDDGQMLTVKVSVSSAEILGMFSAPKELVAAPGSNKMILPLRLVYRMTYNSVAYATHTNIRLGYDSGTAGSALTLVEVASFLSQSSNATMITTIPDVLGTQAIVTTSLTSMVNKNLCLSVATGAPTAGNSTLKISVVYVILDVS